MQTLNLLLSGNLRIRYISSIKGHISRMEQVIKFNIGLGLLFMTLVYKFKWFEWNDKRNLSYWTETWKIKGYFFLHKNKWLPTPTTFFHLLRKIPCNMKINSFFGSKSKSAYFRQYLANKIFQQNTYHISYLSLKWSFWTALLVVKWGFIDSRCVFLATNTMIYL